MHRDNLALSARSTPADGSSNDFYRLPKKLSLLPRNDRRTLNSLSQNHAATTGSHGISVVRLGKNIKVRAKNRVRPITAAHGRDSEKLSLKGKRAGRSSLAARRSLIVVPSRVKPFPTDVSRAQCAAAWTMGRVNRAAENHQNYL
jgi:hypothetical protein